MKRAYTIILGLTFLLFIGCAEESANATDTTGTTEQNGPKSPAVTQKEKVPPSIPNI